MRLLYDVEMTLTAEIGRAKLPVRQILDLTPGAIVELDRVAGSPADLMVNGHLVARGEVVVIDEDYGLRITEILDASEAFA
jgi:flagellar motor switch protein FliN/FliY